MLTMPVGTVEAKAHALKSELESLNEPDLDIRIIPLDSKAGGGSLPAQNLPSMGIALSAKGISANRMEMEMRGGTPPVIGRIEDDLFIMDPRTVEPHEFSIIKDAVSAVLNKFKGISNV
jgi:L-seryl-tRNA(Ser) seleniumtransferase